MSPTIIGKGLLLLAAVAVIFVFGLYRADMKKAYAKLGTYTASTTQTRFGKVAYVDTGKSTGKRTPVLLIHGICGGYDQALASFQGLFTASHRIIAPARFGYLGSDLPDDPNPIDQAEAFKQLLDHLGIQKAIVFGTSAGSGSAIHFASRFPERTQALVLVSTAAPALPDTKLMSGPPSFVYTDFMMWAMARTSKPFFLSMFGVDKAEFAASPESEKASFNSMFDTILPMGPRRVGTLTDNRVTNPDMSRNANDYKIEDIKAPVLIVHAKDDPMATFAPVQAMADRMSNVKLVAFGKGGHVLYNHSKEIKAVVADFLAHL